MPRTPGWKNAEMPLMVFHTMDREKFERVILKMLFDHEEITKMAVINQAKHLLHEQGFAFFEQDFSVYFPTAEELATANTKAGVHFDVIFGKELESN